MSTANTNLMGMAGKSLSGKWGIAIVTFLLYILFTSIGQNISDSRMLSGLSNYFFDQDFTVYFPGYNPLLTILNLVISGPFILGISMFSLSLARNEDARLEQLFDGFKNFKTAITTYLYVLIFTILWTLLLIIPGIIAALSYSQAFFILADNKDIGAMEAIDKSKAMMDGYKLKLFGLWLIYFVLIILSAFTLGIALLWVIPYMHVSMTHFYEDIKEA